MRRLILDRRFWLIPLAIWAAVAAASLSWNYRTISEHADGLATSRGRFVFEMVETVRLWNARHGGVYVFPDSRTEPNPYLAKMDVERDLELPDGRRLTLVNPAYMTRQIGSVLAEAGSTLLRITSLKPINPDNAASPWEAQALTAFEGGLREHLEQATEGGRGVFRYIAPLVTEKACLKCHESQGYQVGDIRGGVSVTFPSSDILHPASEQIRLTVATHVVVWLALSALTLFALFHFRRQMVSLELAKAEQDMLVELRTRELNKEVQERQRAESQLRLLLESSGEGIFGVDRDGRFTFCNPIGLQLLGYRSLESIRGESAFAILQCEHGRCALRQVLDGNGAVHSEDERFRRADGVTIPVSYRVHPLLRDGGIAGAVVTFSDITERKRNEAELRKLSNAVDMSPESVVITDAEGRIEYVNPRFEAVTGYRADEVIGKTPALLQSGRTPVETYQELWRAIRGGSQWSGELLNRKRNGELFWEDETIYPILDESGEVTHFVAIKEDVTERKRMEERIWRQANYDALTDLPNRRLFFDRLEQVLLRARRDGTEFALMYLDLDRFKPINDTLGHEAGDQLLRQSAQRIRDCLRESDTAARIGGDEFTVLLPGADDAGAEEVARKLRQRMAEPFRVAGEEVSVGISVGVVRYPRDGESSDLLLKHADAAMYAAKRNGDIGYLFFDRMANAS